MQSVADRWYVLYNRISFVIAGFFLAGTTASWFTPWLGSIGKEWGLSYTLFGLALMHILYRLIFYRGVAKNHGPAPATLIVALINCLGILSLMQATGTSTSLFIILWDLLMVVIGMFGTIAIVGACFMIATYYVILTSEAFAQGTGFNPLATLPLVSTIVLALASHYLWRKNYINEESRQVAMLSGQLKNKQQQAEILIQSLADGVIVTNTEGKIMLMNPVAATMTQWNLAEAMDLDIALVAKLQSENGNELIHGQDPFTLALTTGKSVNQTLQLVGKDGKQTIVSLVASPVLVPKSTEVSGVVAVLRDVSVAHKEEKQRADFISTASHEMRTPVAAIEGYLALALNEKVSKIDAKARSYLEKAHESTQHLGKLFQDLLTSAKAEDGRLVSHPVVLEMGTYLEQLTDGFRFAAQKKGLLADFTVGAATESGATGKMIRPLYYVHVDPDRLREVITNLFDNAVKYTPSGRVSLGLTGNADVVQLFIRDTGPGIPKEDVPHLFQKFYRVDNSATRTIGGTGLGLFICRKIVELYNGRIWVESEWGKGSTFYINLPRLSTQRAQELQTAEAQNQAPAPVSSLTTPVL